MPEIESNSLTIEQAAKLIDGGASNSIQLYYSVITPHGKFQSYWGDDDHPINPRQSTLDQLKQFIALAAEDRCSDFILTIGYPGGDYEYFQLINSETLEPI